MGVPQAFSELVQRIQPTAAQLASAGQHVASIRTRLQTAFEISDCKITGSFNRNTSIRTSSDVDLFAVFRKSNFTWGGSIVSSTSALGSVRQQLLARFPSTALGKDGMAISVEFSDGQVVDVVPALFDSFFQDKWPIYQMPDGTGGWMLTSPSLYDAYIKKADAQSGGKLKYTAQLIKFWRECRVSSIPLSSFHIEMILASEGVCNGVKSYAECVRDIFRNLAAREGRAIRDPYQIGGYIPAVKTAGQVERTLASVRNSRDSANRAVEAESWSAVEAKRQWDIVFNGVFPK